MSKLEFVALDISGKNYLSWVLDAETHLTTKGLGDSIIEGNTKSSFQKYSELISCLLVAEQHNDLLMKNHEARPAGRSPLPEAHKVDAHDQSEIRQNNRAHDNVREREFLKKKGNKSGAFSSNAQVESHLTLKDDVHPGYSQKYNANVDAKLALKYDTFDGLDDITHLEVEDFFGHYK
ncbi:hypothetical protein EJD97_008777 [Solanum chilense]|uniref:Uncharacterized protein n=1 Tax=Solanum chilense TaxID=4083 RepID=A0A6N2BTS3_SOLCI|nr:hypothetical protein EJD97_008777 [Solanum chilense]